MNKINNIHIISYTNNEIRFIFEYSQQLYIKIVNFK